jgi:large subunit ribosomal protein L5e
MGFVKVLKNKAYFRRFQVKYRRRREAKTDYYARTKLIIQDKNKYKTPKYRFVVRVTNKDIVTQVIAADLTHDVVLAAAYSHELPRYGVKLGLTNYAAAYATGLLLARRVNSKFKLSYEGQKVVDGEDYNVEPSEDDQAAKPFKALLDVGLARTTSGARVFGALKGATDGGIDIPHNDHRFPGSKREGTEWTTSTETHRKYIFGGHISEYMKSLQEDNEELYNSQFKRYVDAGITGDKFEALYTKAHAAIRADPNKKRADSELGYFGTRTKSNPKPVAGKDGKIAPAKRYNKQKLKLSQRHGRIAQKLTKRGITSLKAKKAE